MKRILLVAVFCLFAGLAAVAQENFAAPHKKDAAWFPRFVSFKASLINARSGPGKKYPIEWVYMQENAPVEALAEFDSWFKIRDWQGSESWIKKSLLSKKRFARVEIPGESNLYAKANSKAQVIARVEDGAVGEIKKCPADKDFCLIKFKQVEGWMSRAALYGVYPKEIVD